MGATALIRVSDQVLAARRGAVLVAAAVTVRAHILGSPLFLALRARAIPAARGIASGGPLAWPRTIGGMSFL